ncbi:MAG: DUF3124 domain-containing protein [Desulfotignum sp.]|nr:DUF3124 domain-containing protein [Desulfotignum sp.]MCF8125816.1 DUF3124 domain-containing protein [Desulfotignum sp.]
MASRKKIFICLFIFVFCAASGTSGADDLNRTMIFLSKGQVIYVPVYSHIYIGNRERPFLLAVTLSIRNTDLNNPVVVKKATYYNSQGKLLEEYINTPVTLEKMSATRFVVHESDKAGGSGASFLLEWESEKPVSPPIIETVMIGAQTQQGISFTSRGQVIKEK